MLETASSGNPIYKGKITHRSWPQLPEELLRHIATFYLWDLSANSYCPQIWDTRESWHHRMMFTTLRDAYELEKHMMSICPQWHLALQTHLFWQQAVALIDPNDTLIHHATIHPRHASLNSSSAPVQATKLSPYRHFRNITACSCLICRINSPGTNTGLTIAKRLVYTPYLRTIAVCREHDRRPAAFCGLCLRDAPVFENVVGSVAAAAAAAHENLVAIIDNDDKESFPNVEATCRACRIEWLWKRVCESPRGREAIGGSKMVSDDWETRNIVDSFIDLAEGNIKDVIMLAKEKLWLRTHTRLNDMLMQALAASRFNSGRGYDGDEQEEEEDEDEDEDDIELMQMEENGVRELALGDWARSRILDGHWFSPADIWYNHTVPGKPTFVRAVHPCPWTRDSSSYGSSPSVTVEGDDDEEEHPRSSTVNAEIPPTYTLCEQAFLVHQRQMRVVLLPAMRNIVRKIVIECTVPALGSKVEDPAIRAAKMTMEDVLTKLREEEGVWFDGVDWAERRRNDRREKEKRERDARGGDSTHGCDDSSTASSGSRSSNGTSPVLSTTTLQTTPSPPPIPTDDDKKETRDVEPEASEVSEASSLSVLSQPVAIAVAPVLDPPRLLRPIPYIPVTASHFPHYTLEALKMVWREACAPLYHCRCGICIRAAVKANVANDNTPGLAPSVSVVPSQIRPQAPVPIRPDLVTVKLTDAVDIDGEGEDEIELVEEEEGMEEVDGDDEYEEIRSGSGSGSGSDEDDRWCSPATLTPSTNPPSIVTGKITSASGTTVLLRPRKRSSDEIELGGHLSSRNGRSVTPRSETPPKRARRNDHELHPMSTAQKHRQAPVAEGLPGRIKKRSSEELENMSDESVNKKIRTSPTAPSPVVVMKGDGILTESPLSARDSSRPDSPINSRST